MVGFLDVCKFTAVSSGTGDFVVSAAATGYQTPAGAGAVNATVYRYRAESADLTQWEVGYGAYTSASVTLARTTVLYNSAGTTAKISFTVAPIVGVVLLAEDVRALVNTVITQAFTSNGTYTPTTGMLYAMVDCVGGGGGGGGAAGTAGSSVGAGGGGAGSFARKRVTAADIGASKTVTIGAGGAGGGSGTNAGGAGGDTSVGVLCVGKGASGGAGGATSTIALGGAGGVAGTGDLTPVGSPGRSGTGIANISVFAFGGDGASSFYGGGGQGPIPATTGTGTAGGNYGSGGSGGAVFNTTSNVAGGAGSAGVVFITEFCFQ